MAEIYSVERIFAFPKSINCLRFGPLGDVLAIGGDDGVVTLIDFVQGTTKFRWVAVAPVTALYWQASTILFAGYGDGSIARLDVAMTNGDNITSRRTHPLGAQGVVEHLDYNENTQCLAVALEKGVVICYISPSGSWDLMKQLPLPEPIHGFTDDIKPRSVHFTPDGKGAIVSYLSHGIWCWNVETGENLWKIMPRTTLGRTAASADRNIIVASNLYNGFDCYGTVTRSLVHTFRTRITHNVPLPIEFIHDGTALLFGSSCGDVTLWELESHNWVDSLRHADEDIIQALAYTEVGDRRYIATGVSEPVEHARVCIWSSARPKSMTVATPTVTASRRKVKIGKLYIILSAIVIIVAMVYAMASDKSSWNTAEMLEYYSRQLTHPARHFTATLAAWVADQTSPEQQSTETSST